MKKLGNTAVFYVDGENIKEGLNGINLIETSNIAAHIWNHPEPHTLHHTKSRALMQFDIYPLISYLLTAYPLICIPLNPYNTISYYE